jgi:hypothetical protein
MSDSRNIFEVLIPKLMEATQRFDMVPLPQHPDHPIEPWDGGKDDVLPDGLEAYFLRAGAGPRYVFGGVVVTPLATSVQSNGRFAIASIEGSSWHENKVFKSTFGFKDVHHAFMVVNGTAHFEIEESGAATTKLFAVTVGSAETVYIPKGSRFRMSFNSRFAKTYVFASGAGLVEVLTKAGTKFSEPVIPEKEAAVDQGRLENVMREHGGQLS